MQATGGVELSATAIALISAGSALVGSLVTLWAKWGVEKQRLRLAARREAIQRWRNWVEREYGEEGWRGSVVYHEMRRHLDPGVLKRIDSADHIIIVPHGLDGKKIAILNELARIEKKWGLL